MNKIYLVSDGCYSDYHICGIYSTKEKAEIARLRYNADNDVQEFDLDDIPDTPPGMLAWCVLMDRRGNLPSGLNKYTGSGVRRNSVEDFEPSWRPYGEEGLVSFYVWARDGEHAIKIANEQRIGLLVSGEWLDDFELWLKRKYE